VFLAVSLSGTLSGRRGSFIESLDVSKVRERQRRALKASASTYLLEGLIARLIRNSFRECRSIISRRRHKAAAYMAELPAFCRVLGGVPEAAGAANNRFIDSESRGTTLSLLYDTNTRVGNDLWSDDGAARRPATPRNTRSRNEAFIRAKWRSKVPAEHESAENTSRHRGKRSRIERKSKSDRAIESQQARSIDFFHPFLSLSLSLFLSRYSSCRELARDGRRRHRAALDVNWARRECASVVGITVGRRPNDLRASRGGKLRRIEIAIIQEISRCSRC